LGPGIPYGTQQMPPQQMPPQQIPINPPPPPPGWSSPPVQYPYQPQSLPAVPSTSTPTFSLDPEAYPARYEPTFTYAYNTFDESPPQRGDSQPRNDHPNSFNYPPIVTLVLAMLAVFGLTATGFLLLSGRGVPQTTPEPTPVPTVNVMQEPVDSTPVGETASVEYKMAQLGMDEAVCAAEHGFDENIAMLNPMDFTGATFYSISFAVELDASDGCKPIGIEVYDQATKTELSSTARTAVHVYTGKVPSIQYLSEHPTPDAPEQMVSASSYVVTGVLVSLDKYEFSDLDVCLVYSDLDGEHSEKLEVNSRAGDLASAPAYTVGNSLLKIGEEYFVVDGKDGRGLAAGGCQYYYQDLSCVSKPLTGAVTGLDNTSVLLVSRGTGETSGLPAGMEMYFNEEHEEGSAKTRVCIGLTPGAGDSEAVIMAVDSSLPCIKLASGDVII